MGKNIFLIGFMGAGKSCIASCLKNHLNMNLIEMDARIVQEQKMSINDIFEQYGENYFRNLETNLIKYISKEGNSIISCGGGVVLRNENTVNMKENGIVIYLAARPETIYERIKENNDRPILNGHMNVEYISSLMDKRKEFYENAADIRIDTDGKSPEDICKEIIGII